MLNITAAIVSAGMDRKTAKALIDTAKNAVNKQVISNPDALPFMEAVAKDVQGTWTAFSNPDGIAMGHISHDMKPKDLANLRADMAAWLKSDEYKALPATAKRAAALVDVSATVQALMGLTVADFGKRCEAQGINATIKQGVWALSIPGARGTRYFDAQDGKELAAGESASDKKEAVDIRRIEGKLCYYRGLTKLSKTQAAFVSEHAVLADKALVAKAERVLAASK